MTNITYPSWMDGEEPLVNPQDPEAGRAKEVRANKMTPVEENGGDLVGKKQEDDRTKHPPEAEPPSAVPDASAPKEA
jgi:hypothetical protein